MHVIKRGSSALSMRRAYFGRKASSRHFPIDRFSNIAGRNRTSNEKPVPLSENGHGKIPQCVRYVDRRSDCTRIKPATVYTLTSQSKILRFRCRLRTESDGIRLHCGRNGRRLSSLVCGRFIF